MRLTAAILFCQAQHEDRVSRARRNSQFVGSFSGTHDAGVKDGKQHTVSFLPQLIECTGTTSRLECKHIHNTVPRKLVVYIRILSVEVE